MEERTQQQTFTFVDATHSKCQVCMHVVADVAKEKHFYSCVLKLPLYRTATTQTVECMQKLVWYDHPCQQQGKAFSLEQGSNTDISEIVDLKEITQVIILMLNDMSRLRQDVFRAKRLMVRRYESHVREKATELYCRINDRVRDLEQMHKDKVTTLRQAYRQQLADALVSLHKTVDVRVRNKIRRYQVDQEKLVKKLKLELSQLKVRLFDADAKKEDLEKKLRSLTGELDDSRRMSEQRRMEFCKVISDFLDRRSSLESQTPKPSTRIVLTDENDNLRKMLVGSIDLNSMFTDDSEMSTLKDRLSKGPSLASIVSDKVMSRQKSSTNVQVAKETQTEEQGALRQGRIDEERAKGKKKTKGPRAPGVVVDLEESERLGLGGSPEGLAPSSASKATKRRVSVGGTSAISSSEINSAVDGQELCSVSRRDSSLREPPAQAIHNVHVHDGGWTRERRSSRQVTGSAEGDTTPDVLEASADSNTTLRSEQGPGRGQTAASDTSIDGAQEMCVQQGDTQEMCVQQGDMDSSAEEPKLPSTTSVCAIGLSPIPPPTANGGRGQGGSPEVSMRRDILKRTHTVRKRFDDKTPLKQALSEAELVCMGEDMENGIPIKQADSGQVVCAEPDLTTDHEQTTRSPSTESTPEETTRHKTTTKHHFLPTGQAMAAHKGKKLPLARKSVSVLNVRQYIAARKATDEETVAQYPWQAELEMAAQQAQESPTARKAVGEQRKRQCPLQDGLEMTAQPAKGRLPARRPGSELTIGQYLAGRKSADKQTTSGYPSQAGLEMTAQQAQEYPVARKTVDEPTTRQYQQEGLEMTAQEVQEYSKAEDELTTIQYPAKIAKEYPIAKKSVSELNMRQYLTARKKVEELSTIQYPLQVGLEVTGQRAKDYSTKGETKHIRHDSILEHTTAMPHKPAQPYLSREPEEHLHYSRYQYQQQLQQQQLHQHQLQQQQQLQRQFLQAILSSGPKTAFRELDLLPADEADYKKELERINKVWELKFSILTACLHAYQNERFLRDSLHRQATLMNQAFVSYSSGPEKAPATFGKRLKPLPEINKTLPLEPSLWSCPGTGMFVKHEDQVMSASENCLPEGMLPLPSPRYRRGVAAAASLHSAKSW